MDALKRSVVELQAEAKQPEAERPKKVLPEHSWPGRREDEEAEDLLKRRPRQWLPAGNNYRPARNLAHRPIISGPAFV